MRLGRKARPEDSETPLSAAPSRRLLDEEKRREKVRAIRERMQSCTKGAAPLLSGSVLRRRLRTQPPRGGKRDVQLRSYLCIYNASINI